MRTEFNEDSEDMFFLPSWVSLPRGTKPRLSTYYQSKFSQGLHNSASVGNVVLLTHSLFVKHSSTFNLFLVLFSGGTVQFRMIELPTSDPTRK